MEKMKQTIHEIMENEPFKAHGLKFIGMGADKLVFETPGSDRKIIKISTSFIRDKIHFLLRKEFNIIDDESKLDEFQRGVIDNHDKIEEDISEVFGSEHVLRNGVFKVKIPITKDIIIKLLGDDEHLKPMIEKLDDNVVYEIKTLAETQILADELKDKEKFNTRSFNTALIIQKNFRNAKNISEALFLARDIIDKKVLVGFDENSKNEKFAEITKEIVTKIIKYTKKTGFMLDIFGPDNITVFTKEDGSLDYHLLDVIMPNSRNYNSEDIKDDKNFDLLRHNYVFYYTIKSLGDKLGIEDNLKPEDLNYFKGTGIPTEGTFPIKK